jgi:hypothetical protein
MTKGKNHLPHQDRVSVDLVPTTEQKATEQKELPPQDEKTTAKILDIVQKIAENLTQSQAVELTQVAGQATQTIFTVLLKSGGQPVSMVLSIAVLIVSISLLMSISLLVPIFLVIFLL